MNKNSFLVGLCGLIIGLVVGFFAANHLNKQENQIGNSLAANPAEMNPQVNNMVVRDQHTGGAMMPEITETLDKAKNQPENFEAQLAAGDLYLKIQNFQKAIEFYEIANKIKPDDYQTIVKIGNSYYDSRQFENAEKWYLRALEMKSDDVGVRTDLGITFVERANPDLDRAISEFQTSLKTDPKHEPSLYNLGVAFYKKGNIEGAKEIIQKLESVNPQSELASRLKSVVQ